MSTKLEAAARQALEALDQIATHVGQYDLPGIPNHITTLATLHRDALREALAEVKQTVQQPLTDEQRDAARYRWLRENRATLLITGFFGNGCINRAIDEADQAIDAAIKAAHGITSTEGGAT